MVVWLLDGTAKKKIVYREYNMSNQEDYVRNAKRVHPIHKVLLPLKIALLVTIPALLVLKLIIKADHVSSILELVMGILVAIVYIAFAGTIMYHLRDSAGPRSVWRSSHEPFSKRTLVPISEFEAGAVFWFLAGGCIAAVLAAIPFLRQYIYILF